MKTGCRHAMVRLETYYKERETTMSDDKPKRAIVLSSDDWEGLFIDGKLVSEGHHLGEGRPGNFWLDIGRKYDIDGSDLKEMEVTPEDDDELMDAGSFPRTLDELKGDYS